MTERKAFIDPFWALCLSLVLAAIFIVLFAIIGLIPTLARADDEIKDDPCPTVYQASHAAMMQGAEIYLIENKDEVARGAGFINRHYGTARGVTGFLVAIYQTIDLGEVYPVRDGKTCGYNRSSRSDALEFFDAVKTPDGDPA
jgi:hypothetical protein